MTLPVFKYHPDPIATGSVKPSGNMCRCCGQRRGFVYTSCVYSSSWEEEEEDELEDAICPWCIADGSAAQKLVVAFSDVHSLQQAGMDVAIIDEVLYRTPGFIAWQTEEWLCHCGDACEFHGDAPEEEIARLDDEALVSLCSYFGTNSVEEAREILTGYKPGSDPAVYKFKCRHCGKILYNADFS